MPVTSLTLGVLALLSSISASQPGPGYQASPRVITACAGPAGFNAYTQQASLGDGVDLLSAGAAGNGVVKLVADSKGFDIWHETGDGRTAWSARNSGARIEAVELGANRHHVVLSHEQGQLEHFLFTLKLDGRGELIYSSADTSALTRCDNLLRLNNSARLVTRFHHS